MLLEFLRQIKDQESKEAEANQEELKSTDLKSEIKHLHEGRKSNYKVEDLLPKK